MFVNPAEWHEICTKMFTTVGVPEEDAGLVADTALTADIRGVASHGSVRLPVYRERIHRGLINPTPSIRIVNDCPTLVHLDGDNGLAQVVDNKAAQIAAERANKYGVCCVATYNTNHMALLSHYGLKIAEQGLIAYIMCNTPPFVATMGAAEPVIGTNPICWCIPGKEFPIVLDMAISPARGKIKNAAAAGKPIPEGWALDKNGRPTTDAAAALEGMLLPIAGHKGYGIGVVVEVFSALLTGGKYGKNVTHPLDDYDHKPNCGNFIMALDPSKIMAEEDFVRRVDDYVQMVKSSKKSSPDADILFPGELEHRNELLVAERGLEISDETYQQYKSMVGQ